MKVEIDAHKVVQVTSNHGGYLGGECSICGAVGWLDGHGYPHGSKIAKGHGNRLTHTKSCPMNKVLNEDASLKGKRKPKRAA